VRYRERAGEKKKGNGKHGREGKTLFKGSVKRKGGRGGGG